MSQSELKDIRKQLRNIVKEHLNDAFVAQLKADLLRHVDLRLNSITTQMSNSLAALDKRSKDVSISLLQAVKPIVPTLKT
jgi:hypothetical protein